MRERNNHTFQARARAGDASIWLEGLVPEASRTRQVESDSDGPAELYLATRRNPASSYTIYKEAMSNRSSVVRVSGSAKSAISVQTDSFDRVGIRACRADNGAKRVLPFMLLQDWYHAY